MDKRIKQILKENGMNAKGLAAMLEISNVSLSHQMHGDPKLSSLKKIASVLGVPVWQLFVSPEEIVRKKQAGEDESRLRCPHCGKPINVVINK